MARPIKNNCEYFPHFTTMRNHRKVKALRNKFGAVLGYAFWSMFIEYLTELDGNELELNNIECEMFAAELGVSAAEIPPMINYCIDIELLFKTENNFIYSESLNETLKPVYDKRNNEREKSKTRKRRENGSFCKHNNHNRGVSAAETPQSKVNRSKVNKIIIEKPLWAFEFENFNNEILYPFEFKEFGEIWDLWIDYRKEKRLSKYKKIGEQAALKKLSEMSSGNIDTAKKIIEQSIANNWQGFFELKNNGIFESSKNTQQKRRDYE